jgi:hypothetical protein
MWKQCPVRIAVQAGNSLPGLRSAGMLGELAGQAVNYIADVVAEMLSVAPSQTKHLEIFREATGDQRFEEVNLFRLNHDRLLECFLRSKDVRVVDGFNAENTFGIRTWNPALFDSCRTLAGPGQEGLGGINVSHGPP